MVSCTTTAKHIRAIYDGKLLPSAIYGCNSVGDRHLHSREIRDLKILFCSQFKQQNTHHSCKRLPKRFGVTRQPMEARP